MKTDTPKKRPPASEKPAGGLVKPICRSVIQQSRDIDTPHWTIVPDPRVGLVVTVSASGHVVMKQSPWPAADQEIKLHPDEAQALVDLLPQAIGQAEFIRHGGLEL